MNDKQKKLDKAYIETMDNIKTLIDEGHDPNNIKLDNDALLDDIDYQIHSFYELCENENL